MNFGDDTQKQLSMQNEILDLQNSIFKVNWDFFDLNKMSSALKSKTTSQETKS